MSSSSSARAYFCSSCAQILRTFAELARRALWRSSAVSMPRMLTGEKDEEEDDARAADPLLGTELSEDGVDEIRRFFVGDGPSERTGTKGLNTGGEAEGVMSGKRAVGFKDGALDCGRAKPLFELIVHDVEDDAFDASSSCRC